MCIGCSLPPANAIETFIPFGGLTNQLKNAINDNPGDLPVPRYQQVFDSTKFGEEALTNGVPIGQLGLIRITEISFEEADSQIGGTPGLLGGLFTLRLSTTPKPVNGLWDPSQASVACNGGADSDFDCNLNPLSTAVFDSNVVLSSVSAAGVLTFTGGPFFYDPLAGENLILDFQISGFRNASDLTLGLNSLNFKGTDQSQDVLYSAAENWDGVDNQGIGLITKFAFTVPEPGTAVLVALGLAGLSGRRRALRRR